MAVPGSTEPLLTGKVLVRLTPDAIARLERFAARKRWTRAAAARALIEQGLDEDEQPLPARPGRSPLAAAG
jgi:hypothetical protein